MLGRALEGVGMESHRSIIIFRFMIYGLCYFKIRTNGLRFVICIIGLAVHRLYKYRKFGNLLVNFYFTYGILIRRSFKISSDDTGFLKLNSIYKSFKLRLLNLKKKKFSNFSINHSCFLS